MHTSPLRIDGETLGRSLDHIAYISPDSRARFPEAAESITMSELRDASMSLAIELAGQGVVPGELTAVLMDTTPLFLVTMFALWRLGVATTVLPASQFGSAKGELKRIGGIVSSGRISQLMVDVANLDTGRRLSEPQSGRKTTVVTSAMTSQRQVDPRGLPSVDPDALAYVQYTSGSTSVPKGVRLTHRNVLAGIRACAMSGDYRPDDILVQWAPVYHDLGLFGMLSCMLNGAECHIFTPRTLLRDPGGLLSYFSEHRGTLMTGPDFSYDHLIGGVSAAQLATLDFSSWRLAYNGAEPVNAQTLHRFTETLAPHGLDPSVMFPVYGMAEATLAVSYPEPGAGPAVLHVDRSQLGPGDTVITVAADAAGSRALVSVGRPVHGIDLRIIDEHGSPTETGCVGEIEIRGEAVTDGYYNDPDATAAAFRNGWLRTGDLGFTHDDHLYVMGRSKEMIIVHGENYFPSDVEEIVRTVPGVFRNRGIAFPGRRDGYEYMGVIVETKAHPEQQEDIRTEVRRRIAEDLGLNTVEVHLVEPHWLPRTTSGKWQRLAAAKALGALD